MATVSGIRLDEEDEACQKGKAAAEKVMDLIKGHDVSAIKEKFLTCQGISSLTPSEKEYFLKWTQLFIDDLTTENVSSILQNYDGTWSEVLMLKEKTEQSDQLRAKQQELEQISEKLHKATFGLEHIYREMGQIYEAHASLQKQPLTGQTDWSQYPELAAELMISGHPIELMDGIQSSGKSTMLNAMFGLQFAVSAGRCTKGAFMQLLKVSDEMRDLLKFDYVLVVDTEGLRALELAGDSTLHRDNELATFVVGLGNMTLINVFGENPSEMQDVLEIVIQAFMRMKVVKLSPSCVFVHQNVADVAAAEKSMEGRRRLQEKLDKMVQLAAEEEVYDAQSFSSVISFNVHEDVKYFAQLWEGSPPMAPPNPGYSESIQDLKNFIISRASQSTGITLSQFKSKVQDLWNALLNENFVFSFKNTYEISVYRKLEGSTIEASCIDSATNLADEMRCNHPVFNGNRRNLEKHMMKLLAEDEDFDGFMTYIHTPKKYMKTFIGKEVEKYIKVKRDKEMMGDLSPDDIKKYRLQPDQILIDQLCNCCWVTCPFCSAVCTNTVKDHSPDKHSAPFHRPNGVNGRRKGEIPNNWGEIKKEDAIKSLDEL
ncbi:Interferon-induced very large GTPase 1 [Takifugu flavidus]|uniref:Interferon-induced very large GTPase 1 n=1 Tax=Takifugu flavidus TaxID=433684 RepID=A0A5C6NQH1_9TELE|nr:Interferon-induced very large GTPase 1 [Takifugu flavidus]